MEQFCQLFNKYLHLILLIIFFSACSVEHNEVNIGFRINEIEPKDSSSKSFLTIASQLSQFLDNDDFFIFNQDICSEDAFNFSTVHDFVKFKNDHSLYFEPSNPIEMDAYYITRFKDIYNLIMAIEIEVFQKLEDEDSNIDYLIKLVESRIKGNSRGRDWEQLFFGYEIFNGTAVIDLEGVIQYKLFISNYGIVFSDSKS